MSGPGGSRPHGASAESSAASGAAPDLLLGLIGDNIAASSAPRLHELAGQQNGLVVRYDRLVPKALGMPFEALLEYCAGNGYRGVNVTYPYKERAARLVSIPDPLVRAMGAVNTVLFEADGMAGYNTDHSGFVAAYRAARKETPGVVAMIGAGGVGRAVAFGLLALGVRELRLVDRDSERVAALAAALGEAASEGAGPRVAVHVIGQAEAAAEGADGVINCTPVGMVGYPGTPVAAAALKGLRWAFDAVYTPVETAFLSDARAAGAQIVSGYELFFHQGLDAWRLFAGLPLDAERLRKSLHDEGRPQ